MDTEQNINFQEKNNSNCISAAEIEAEVFRIWDGLDLYTNHVFEIVCNATPYAKCLFGYGFDGFCFYIPIANKFYHIWRDGNFYHDYYFEKEELQKNDVLELLYNGKKFVSPSKNGLQAKNLEEIIKYVESLP